VDRQHRSVSYPPQTCLWEVWRILITSQRLQAKTAADLSVALEGIRGSTNKGEAAYKQ
jgi:hypothetical protein